MKDHLKNTVTYQKILVVVSITLFVIKLVAWYFTGSVAILTDAIESTVNVVAGFMGLYSIMLSSKPKDKEHPYGHGKVEFITSAIEGILIAIAGCFIIYEAISNFFKPHALQQLGFGLILISATGIVNYIVGYYVEKKGKEQNSPVLISSGAHLKSDTYSTVGLMIGIALVMITGYKQLDSIVALVFALLIIYTGYKIVRKSISGIMDESDLDIIQEIVIELNKNRTSDWIDVHNLRVINYAGFYHIDCHLTVPYYLNVHEAHNAVDSLTDMFTKHFANRVEFFIHVDGCLPFQCSICDRQNCPVRESNFIKHIDWTEDNILSNQKHRL